MTRLQFLVIFVSTLSSCNSDQEPSTTFEDFNIDTLISVVASQKIVQDYGRLVDSVSDHTRHLSFQARPQDSLKRIYLVQVGEDNGHVLSTHFNFLIDPRTFKILNPSGKLEGQ